MRTIVHLSDLHFGRIDPLIVSPLVDAIRAIAPHVVAVSGDLTQRARASQFVEARAFLARLPSPQIVVPGNHDVPLYNVAKRFLRPLASYTRFITADLEPIFADDELMMVGLNSARSAILAGRGRLSPGQVGRAAARLDAAGSAIVKIVVTHHPFDLPEGHGDQHLVGRSRMAMARFASAGADVFLAGHLHLSHTGRTAERYKIAGHDALVVQAGTMSTRGRGELNSFNVLSVNRASIAIHRHTWDEGHAVFRVSRSGAFDRSPAGWVARAL